MKLARWPENNPTRRFGVGLYGYDGVKVGFYFLVGHRCYLLHVQRWWAEYDRLSEEVLRQFYPEECDDA